LLHVVQSFINPILLTIWNRHVTGGNIQIANYNLKNKKQGAWHHDASSDVSIVVPLNTGDYKGGGTEFLNRGVVEPLPTGSGLIFPSYTHMHRGLAVEEGDRYLLVFWLNSEEESINSKEN
jgi:predicted 2-oxoglutarate/Fe(II)-dependent dioxygenase YbiX